MGERVPVTSERWVALLRGVNVGGITIRSAALAQIFRDLGFGDVKTVLASGNVLFSTAGSAAELKQRIETQLAETFGYEAWIILLRQAQLAPIVDAYPFDERDDRQSYIVFVSEAAAFDELAGFGSEHTGQDEQVAPGDGVLYWEVPRGSSTDTAMAKKLAKKRYKSVTTTRNLRTVRKLL